MYRTSIMYCSMKGSNAIIDKVKMLNCEKIESEFGLLF